jgi:hypothetical protein
MAREWRSGCSVFKSICEDQSLIGKHCSVPQNSKEHLEALQVQEWPDYMFDLQEVLQGPMAGIEGNGTAGVCPPLFCFDFKSFCEKQILMETGMKIDEIGSAARHNVLSCFASNCEAQSLIASASTVQCKKVL